MRMKSLAFVAMVWLGLVSAADAADLRVPMNGQHVEFTAPDDWEWVKARTGVLGVMNPERTVSILLQVGEGEATYEWIEQVINAGGKVYQLRRAGEAVIDGRRGVSLTGMQDSDGQRHVIRYHVVALGDGQILMVVRLLTDDSPGADVVTADTLVRGLRVR